MKVSGTGSTSGASPTRPADKAASAPNGAFAKQLAESAEPVEGPRGVDAPAAVAGIDALLAAQAVGDSLEQEARRKLIRRGDDLLDKLDEIRHGLLIGSIPKDRLIALAQMVRSRRDSMPDPRLATILDEIELRAEVELAKLSRR